MQAVACIGTHGRQDEWYIRTRSQGSELAQSYTGVVTLGCTPLTAFACFQAVQRERRMAVRSPTRNTGRWNTIVALFEGRSFRTCGGAGDLIFATQTKELISRMHRGQSYLSGITASSFFLPDILPQYFLLYNLVFSSQKIIFSKS